MPSYVTRCVGVPAVAVAKFGARRPLSFPRDLLVNGAGQVVDYDAHATGDLTVVVSLFEEAVFSVDDPGSDGVAGFGRGTHCAGFAWWWGGVIVLVEQGEGSGCSVEVVLAGSRAAWAGGAVRGDDVDLGRLGGRIQAQGAHDLLVDGPAGCHVDDRDGLGLAFAEEAGVGLLIEL